MYFAAYQCACCGRRFGVASNLNRHVKRCVLRTSPTSGTTPTSGSAQTTPSPPPPTKRRRRAPATSFWVPASLRSFVLVAATFRGTVISPAAPLGHWDERNSFAPAPLNPYHPSQFSVLPGPAFPASTMEWERLPGYYDSRSDGSKAWGMGVLGVRVF